MAEWQRVVNTTTAKYFREEEMNILRKRILLALLQEKGRITFGHSGERMDWKIHFAENGLVAYHDMGTLGMNRFNRHKTAQLDWRGYEMSESLSEKERLMNRGQEAIIKYYTELMQWMKKNAERKLAGKFFLDGNATGYEDDYHGLESCMGDSGTPSTVQPIAVNSDSYAGLSTVLGDEDGTWDSAQNWPDGTGDSSYDFWTPLLVDISSVVAAPAGWTSTPKTWANTCIEAMRFAIINMMRNRAVMPDVFLMTSRMYRDVLNYHDPLQRIFVERNGDNSKAVKMGFPGGVSVDGVDISWDYDVPADTAYGICVDELEFRCMYDQIFNARGPTYEDRTASYLYSVMNFGNLVINPRNQSKLKAYTT